MQVTIVPRPVQLVNHCLTTCTARTGRTSRVKPFTGRICSTVLDKDGEVERMGQVQDLKISLITFKEKEISFHFSKIVCVKEIFPSEL